MSLSVFALNNYFVGTAQKKYVKNAIRELSEYDPDIKIIDRYPDGIFTFKTCCYREVLYFKMKEQPPVFLRHIHPIDRMIFVPMDMETPDVVVDGVVSLSDRIKPGKKVSVQARRVPGEYSYTLFTIKKNIDPILEKSYYASPTVKRPQQIISIFVADSTSIDIKDSPSYYSIKQQNGHLIQWKEVCFLGVGTPKDNLNEWSGGEVRFSKDTDQKSRAEFKLLEAFELFPLSEQTGGKALDLGSSPGGWTRILLQKGYDVTAVDRAPLDKDIMADRKVRFIQKDALHFRDKPGTYDILTDDMNQDPAQSAKAIMSAQEALKSGGPLIWTIKLTGNNPEKTIEKVSAMIKPNFEIKRIRQLYHNRDEVTLWAVKK